MLLLFFLTNQLFFGVHLSQSGKPHRLSVTPPVCSRPARCPGNRILTLGEVPKDQVYGVKLKGVSVCFAMLKAVLSGNYVNFGVFRLYGDDALDNALQTFIKLLLSIPHSDLLVSIQ